MVAGEVLTLQGIIASHGRIDVQGNDTYGFTSQIQVGGAVTLSDVGVVALTDLGVAAASSTQVITSITPGAKLDNIGNTIIGNGLLSKGQSRTTRRMHLDRQPNDTFGQFPMV
jgi:hypothetical protein